MSDAPAAPTRIVTMEELKSHGTKESMYLLIHGKVYDCTNFMDEHPGGDEVILSEKGQDATEAFEDVGHSDEARSQLPAMLVGEIEGGAKSSGRSGASGTSTSAVEQGSNMMYIAPLGALGAYFAWRYYSGSA